MIIRLNQGLLWGALATYLLLAIAGSQLIDPFNDAPLIANLTMVFIVAYVMYMAAVNCVYSLGWAIDSLFGLQINEETRENMFNVIYGLCVSMPPVLAGVILIAFNMPGNC